MTSLKRAWWNFQNVSTCFFNIHFWTVMPEKTLESPLDCKEIKPINAKGNKHWIFIGRTNAEVEAPILWPCDEKRCLIRKDPDAGKDWWREEKGRQRMRWLDDIILTQWTWIWANSGREWRTGNSGLLHSMGLQRIR